MGDLRERSYLGWFDREIEADKQKAAGKLPELVVTRDGVPLADQTEGVRLFKEACIKPANDNRLEAPAAARANHINGLVDYFHGKSLAAGWWNEKGAGESLIGNPYVIATKLMLCVTELAEAMEGLRKDLMDDKLPHRKMGEVELGDTLIRICDLAGALGYDLGGATMEKDAYNSVRADHKPGARTMAGGKRY